MLAAMLGFVVSGITLAAAETAGSDVATYIAVPMHMFNRLTGDKPEKQAPETFIYHDGKLVKCETNLPIKKNDCKKKRDFDEQHDRKQGRKNFGKIHKKGPKYDDKVVLLMPEQIKGLMKQKLEQKLKNIDNHDFKMTKVFDKAVQAAPIVKVNGKDSKIITHLNMLRGNKKDGNCLLGPAPAPPILNDQAE